LALTEYKRKRDFSRTPEPRTGAGKSHRRPIFVVQEHDASHLHYDFRLEADGVLKSWAIPKQPTLDTSAKRLAVHVEDHPLDYANFSGTIPEGEYGAGTVKIWDKGTYENLLATKPEPKTVAKGIEDGHLEVDLRGRKLKGRFALVRMNSLEKKDNWLLIKMKDEKRGSSTRRDRAPARASEPHSRPPSVAGKRSHLSNSRTKTK
jgi:DNA ligase D-like protein (predicted 3'-phosphoesterase)